MALRPSNLTADGSADGGGGGGGGGGWAIAPLLFVPPVRARARFVAVCLAAADGAATATVLQRWLRTAFAESVCAVAFPGAFGAVRAWHGQLSAAGSEELEEAARRVEAALAASLPAGSYRVEARDVGRYG
mmetsp:Transcript_13664/g.40066  ORF Transcript_13664/g.40066 Transcript_13664/m.40066 type:complete len:131 (+) Transcript_13664:145-537(+)